MGKDQELLLAVREGNNTQVARIINKLHASKKLSSKKFNINQQDGDGLTFLHQAALNGNAEVMKIFIDFGCHIDSKDSKGMRALHYAAWQGKDLPVDLLLHCNSDVNDVSFDGNSALHLASEHGHSTVVDLLIQQGADISIKNKKHKTALDVACEFGRTKVVETLLRLDCAKDLLMSADDDVADNDRTTCLHLASRNGHVDVIVLLVKAGIDINRQTLQGTCLHEASKFGKVEVVRLLLDYGVDATRLNSYEQTALEIVNKFTASKAARELKQILKEASSDIHTTKNPSREIPYFGSPLLGKTSYSTIKRNHSSGNGGSCKQSKSPKPSIFSPGINLPTNYNSPIFQSSRTNITSGVDDDVFCSKGVSLSLTSSSSSVTSGFKNQNNLCAEHRDSGISSNLSVKVLKPFNQFPNNNMNSRMPQGDSRRCYDPTHFSANPVQGYVNHSHNNINNNNNNNNNNNKNNNNNRVSGTSGGSDGNVSIKSCRPYFPNYSNNVPDFSTASTTTTTTTNNNRLSGQSYESGVSTSSRHSFHSNGSSSGGSGTGGDGSHPHLEESGFSSLGNFPDLLSQGHTNVDIMHGWLSSMNLEELFHLFNEAGYDMPTISRMTPEDLNAIGITKPNVRKKLKFEISRLNVPDGLPDFIPNSVHDWLELLNLVQYEHALMSQGYKDINCLLQITWEDLEEIGITKLGHQKKITLAIDRLKRLLSNSSSPASSSDSLSTPNSSLHQYQPHLHQTFVHHPYIHNPHGAHPNIHTGSSPFDPRTDSLRLQHPNLPSSPPLLQSFTSSNNSLYATISDTIGRRGSVGSTTGIGTNRNWKSTSGESLQRMVELRNLSDFLSADPTAARFEDLNVWQPQVATCGNDEMTSTRDGFGRLQSFNPHLRRDPSLRLSAERTFCSPRQLSLFSNNAFNFGFATHQSKQPRQSPEVALNSGGYPTISSGDSTPTNERRVGPGSTANFGDSGFFQDTINNNNNHSDDSSNSINSLLNHYMNSSNNDDNIEDNSNNNNNNSFTTFKRQKSADAQDHSLLPPSYLYGSDQSDRRASDELRDLTLRTGPYASIPQDLSTNQVPLNDLQSHVMKKDQPPLPPVRSNSFRAESRSLFGLVGEKLHHGGRFEILSNSTIAVVAEEEDECSEDAAEERRGSSGSSSSSEDSDMAGVAAGEALRKSHSTASLSSSDGSVGTLDGNTLPFANENVGTIKQRNNNNNNHHHGDDGNGPSSDVSSADETTNHSDVTNNNKSSCEAETNSRISTTIENNSVQNNSNSDKLFNDIDGMLLGLTQELDEMLKLQP